MDFPPRYDNLLDILLTNRPSLMSRVDGIPGVSGHQGILASSHIEERYRRPVKRKILSIGSNLTKAVPNVRRTLHAPPPI